MTPPSWQGLQAPLPRAYDHAPWPQADACRQFPGKLYIPLTWVLGDGGEEGGGYQQPKGYLAAQGISPGSCGFPPGQRRRNRKCKYVQEPGEAMGYRPQFHWDSTQRGRGRQAGQARMACAAEKGPTLGSRRPLLDAPALKRGKSRWAELLNPPAPFLPRWGARRELTSHTSDAFLL